MPGPNNIIKIVCSFFLSFLSGRLFISFMFQESTWKSKGTECALLQHFSIGAVMRTGRILLGNFSHSLHHISMN